MRCLDLFCGAVGGWTLGTHRAGWTTVAACEADPWRRAVFAANWPDVVMFDDVRTLTTRALAGLGPIDAIIGSPPCQDASTANARGRGVDGERTGLFFEFVRLVREVRPRWVCAENVPGIRARGIDRVLGEMEAAGYTVWPLVVGAWHAGAPHRRNRVWIICRRNDVADPAALQRAALARREPDGVGAGAAPDSAEAARADHAPRLVAGGPAGAARPGSGCGGADAPAPNPRGDGVRQQPRRRGGPDGAGAAEPADDDGEPVGPCGRAGQPAERRSGLASEDGRQMLAGWDHWNGGAPDLGRVDDGLSAALAARRGLGRACLAAYGDAVVPAITEQIARAIDAIERG